MAFSLKGVFMKKDKVLLTGLTAASVLFAATAAKAELFKIESVKFANAETTPTTTTPPPEGKCGEGKCGEAMMGKGKDAKTGETVKEKDGKCGEGTCGSADPKAATTPTPAPTEVKANKADDAGQSGY